MEGRIGKVGLKFESKEKNKKEKLKQKVTQPYDLLELDF